MHILVQFLYRVRSRLTAFISLRVSCNEPLHFIDDPNTVNLGNCEFWT